MNEMRKIEFTYFVYKLILANIILVILLTNRRDMSVVFENKLIHIICYKCNLEIPFCRNIEKNMRSRFCEYTPSL